MQLIQVKVCGLEAGEAGYRMLEAFQMVGRFQSCGSRGRRFARGALHLAVIAVTAVAILMLATPRESQARPSTETSVTAIAPETVLSAFVGNAETASISTGQAIVENLKCFGVGSYHRSGAPCSSGHGSTCWMAIPVVGVAFISPDNFAGHVLKRDVGFLPTGQTPKFRPPRIVV